MTRILRLLSILIGLSLSAPDTASSQTSKGGSVPPSPAAVAIGKSDFDSNCGGCHPITSGQNGFGPGALWRCRQKIRYGDGLRILALVRRGRRQGRHLDRKQSLSLSCFENEMRKSDTLNSGVVAHQGWRDVMARFVLLLSLA